MYFAAIALCVSLFLGGGAVVATHTEAGEKAIESVSNTWSGVKADIHSRFESETDVKADVDADASVTADGALQVRGSQDEADYSTSSSGAFEVKATAGGNVDVGF